MNDRYLCKGKDKDDGKWYEGYYLCLHDTTYCCLPSDNEAEAKRLEGENTHHYIVFDRMTDWGLPNKHLRAEILPKTLCRCTGLKDKNGKLIWENDIVKVSTNKGNTLCEVRYADSVAQFQLWQLTTLHKTATVLNLGNYEEEVIGNIFDNPELLEVGE